MNKLVYLTLKWSEWCNEHDSLVFCAKIIIIATSLFLLLILGALQIGRGSCDTLARLNPDRQFQFQFYGGCYVETGSGLWITTDGNWHIELDK